jgi:hypothetical protein
VTAPARFKQEDVTRIMRGAKKAGFSRVRLSFDPLGNIVVDASNDSEESPAFRPNPLDRILKRP